MRASCKGKRPANSPGPFKKEKNGVESRGRLFSECLELNNSKELLTPPTPFISFKTIPQEICPPLVLEDSPPMDELLRFYFHDPELEKERKRKKSSQAFSGNDSKENSTCTTRTAVSCLFSDESDSENEFECITNPNIKVREMLSSSQQKSGLIQKKPPQILAMIQERKANDHCPKRSEH